MSYFYGHKGLMWYVVSYFIIVSFGTIGNILKQIDPSVELLN